jgi:nucleoside-diphosphate-sugar epimerase
VPGGSAISNKIHQGQLHGFYLVIGGAGFIGSHIVEALVRRGDRVRVFDNFTTGKRANLRTCPTSVIEGDIRDALRSARSWPGPTM